MILTCIEALPTQIIEGRDYFCVEISTSMARQKIFYRLVNEYKTMSLYDAAKFKVKSNTLSDVILEQDDDGDADINFLKIRELDLSVPSTTWIWNQYYEYDDQELIQKIHSIVQAQAEKEGFFIPEIEISPCIP